MDSLNNFSPSPVTSSREGFTLIEVIIVIVIIGILCALGVPGFIKWGKGYHLKATTRDIYSSIQKAKMTAIKGNNDWAMAITDTGGVRTCVFYSDDGGDGSWNDGNEIVASTIDLNTLPGEILFQDPGGTPSSSLFIFRANGTCISGNIYLSNQENSAFYRIQTSPAGGITLDKWSGLAWQ